MHGVSRNEIEDVIAIRSAKLYNGNIDNLLAEVKEPENLKKTVRRMLDRDAESRVKLDSLLLVEECNGAERGEKQEMKEPKTSIVSEEIKENEEKCRNQKSRENNRDFEYKEHDEYPENEENKKRSSSLLKVARFEKTHLSETWDYELSPSKDGIAFTASKDIQIEGFGFYVPTSPERAIKGTVAIYKGLPRNGTMLRIKEITITSNAPEVLDYIYRVMFHTPEFIEAETQYTICLNLKAHVRCCAVYKGTGGKSTVTGEKGVVFTFKGVFGKTCSSDFHGQIPEVYYRLEN